jgi:hypothetical protein
MTHYKWLIARATYEEDEDYALRQEDYYDYCEVEQIGEVREVYEELLKPDSQLARMLRLSGISTENVPQWLKGLIEKGKGKHKVFIIDCHD